MWVSSLFYESVVQAVLKFGSETRVLMPRMVRTLGYVLSDDGMTSMEVIQRGVVLPTPGGVYAEDRYRYNRKLNLLSSEHNCPIYCDSADIGAVSGGRVVPRDNGIK